MGLCGVALIFFFFLVSFLNLIMKQTHYDFSWPMKPLQLLCIQDTTVHLFMECFPRSIAFEHGRQCLRNT